MWFSDSGDLKGVNSSKSPFRKLDPKIKLSLLIGKRKWKTSIIKDDLHTIPKFKIFTSITVFSKSKKCNYTKRKDC